MASKGYPLADYDVNLLSSMPVATKAQLQVHGNHQDYDVGLLTSAPGATEAQLRKPDLLVEKAAPPADSAPVERGDQEQLIPPKVPFHRTRKGVIIIVVALVVIIAVAVGGGIAGSKKKATPQQGAAQGSTLPNTGTISIGLASTTLTSGPTSTESDGGIPTLSASTAPIITAPVITSQATPG